MERVPPVLWLCGALVCCGAHGAAAGVAEVSIDVSGMVRRVDRRFLSVTIDASLATEEKFMYLLSSERIRTLASSLSPAFLRFGGTRQDFMVFSPQERRRPGGARPWWGGGGRGRCQEAGLPSWLEDTLKTQWKEQERLLLREELNRKYRRLKFTELTVDLLHSFSSCSGLDLIFGLNALLRTADNRWNSSNAASLLDYCSARGYNISWELGNEPNSFEKKAGLRVSGDQLGRDFTHLRRLLHRSAFYAHAPLFGPDVGQPRDHRTDILDGFLRTGSDAIDAFTWHHYYVNGRDTSLEDFLDPEVLDTLVPKTHEVLQKVQRRSPGKAVWLGETSSAYGGGAPGLSDTFAAGFMWMDKLGMAAQLGLGVVMRQVLVGSGTYHLVDEDLRPLPDYWLSVLHKRLVGPQVLGVRVRSNSTRRGGVRAYVHCASTQSYASGAVTLMAMNLRRHAAVMALPQLVRGGAAEAFVLQGRPAGEGGLLSRSVSLNGRLLEMLDERTLPDLSGQLLPAADHLQLPGFSLAFYVFPEAGAAACL